MCSFPVMFGGGITVVNGFLLRSTSAWKYLFSHHLSYSFSSIAFGSYVFANSLLIFLSLLSLSNLCHSSLLVRFFLLRCVHGFFTVDQYRVPLVELPRRVRSPWRHISISHECASRPEGF